MVEQTIMNLEQVISASFLFFWVPTFLVGNMRAVYEWLDLSTHSAVTGCSDKLLNFVTN